jgi:glycosyltransferase involved in cell wall biosynthesis
MPDASRFSVVVPTHDRPRLLRRCLSSVLAQEFPADRYEVVVVDDGSRPPARRALAPFLDDGRVTALRQPQRGWGAARRAGARRGRGEILVFLDDDCAPPPGWLAAYERAYAAHPEAGGVAGGLRPGGRMNVAGRKQYLGHRAYFNRLNAPLGTDVDRAGRAWFTFGGNRSFRRDAWWSAQPEEPMWYFDDYAIDLALRERGCLVYYEPAAWVAHHYVLGVGQRVRAAYRYGRSEVSRELPEGAGPAPLPLLERWARLRGECPTATVWELVWYAATQPLAWLARRMGQRAARGEGA